MNTRRKEAKEGVVEESLYSHGAFELFLRRREMIGQLGFVWRSEFMYESITFSTYILQDLVFVKLYMKII
jgi:hypothetical protein